MERDEVRVCKESSRHELVGALGVSDGFVKVSFPGLAPLVFIIGQAEDIDRASLPFRRIFRLEHERFFDIVYRTLGGR